MAEVQRGERLGGYQAVKRIEGPQQAVALTFEGSTAALKFPEYTPNLRGNLPSGNG
jgi:hypothetical protein